MEFLLRVVNLGLLDVMLQQPPTPPVEATPAPVPVELTIGDWESERGGIEARVLRRPDLHDALVPSFDDSVLLLTDQKDPLLRYLVIDGEIQFVVDGEEMPQWQRLLDGIDGQRTLGELLAAAECQLSDVEEVLFQSAEFGLLTLSGPATGE
ncbi:hypothetical protein CA983_43970 [Streptomyces swartbergensis]|uniref:Uncharacterized protein n=1 Tax=Streptomyces swartbergensis TaxID=487165 RepID=A0A243Q575_9ACTN|nr:hypothetical protein CA983_43970 [Streptomyces swartbergensis]